jgi:methyl-accepting chemotaxis protein
MLQNFSIKTRIVGGSLVVILVMSLIAVIGLYAVGSLSRIFDAYESGASGNSFASTMRGDIIRLQLLGRTYFATGAASEAEKVRREGGALQTRLEQAVQATGGAQRQAVAEILKNLRDYRSDFDAAETLVRALDAAKTSVINKIGIDIRKQVSAANDQAIKSDKFETSSRLGLLQESLMLARIRVQRFLEAGDPADMTGGRQVAAEFGKALTSVIPTTDGTIHDALTAAAVLLPAYLTGIDEIDRLYTNLAEFKTKKLAANEDRIFVLLEGLTGSTAKTMADNAAATRALAADSIIAVAAVSATAIVLSLLLAWLIARGIANPVQRLNRTMIRLADGDSAVSVEGLSWRHEIGAMARAVEVFRGNAIEKRRLEDERQEKHRSIRRRQEEVDQLVGLFGNSMTGVFRTVTAESTKMLSTSSILETAASETSLQADRVMAEAERSAAGAQAVAAASQQLSSSIEEIGRQVSQSSSITGAALMQAARAVETVGRLRNATESIGSVIDLIQGIAAQTNLLALNATIEAARAGDAGKGFAVVAGEVKSLANQTSAATTRIGGQISAMQAATLEAIAAIDAINGTIGDINEIATGIAAAVNEQGAATQEIARSIEQVSSSSSNVTASIIEVRGATTEGGRMAVEVKNTARALSAESTLLSSEVTDFIGALKDLGDDESLRVYDVDLPAVVTAGGRAIPGRVITISAGVVTFTGAIDIAPGTRLSLDIAALGRQVEARFAGPQNGGMALQLPLNHAHLIFMEQAIAGIVKRAA